MDTEMDFIEENKEEYLGANEKDFLSWINYNVGINIVFNDRTYATEKVEIMLFLKERYWKEYLDDIEHALKADKEKEVSLHS